MIEPEKETEKEHFGKRKSSTSVGKKRLAEFTNAVNVEMAHQSNTKAGDAALQILDSRSNSRITNSKDYVRNSIEQKSVTLGGSTKVSIIVAKP